MARTVYQVCECSINRQGHRVERRLCKRYASLLDAKTMADFLDQASDHYWHRVRAIAQEKAQP